MEDERGRREQDGGRHIVAFGGQGVDVVPAHLLELEAVFREELPLVGKLAKHHLHHVSLQLD